MPPRRRAGRLEIEVAGNLDKFKRDMASVRREAKRTAGDIQSTLSPIGRFFEFVTDNARALFQVMAGGVILVRRIDRVFKGLSTTMSLLRFVLKAVGVDMQTMDRVMASLGRTAGRTVRVSLDAMRTSLQKLRGFLNDPFGSLNAGLARVGELAGRAFGAIVREGSTMERLFQRLGAVLAKFRPVLDTTIMSIGGLAHAAGTAATPLDRFLGKITQIFGVIGAKAGPVFAKFGAQVGAVARTIGSVFTNSLNILGRVFGSVFEQVVAFTEIGLKAMGSGLRSMADNFRNAAGEIEGFGKVLSGMATVAEGAAKVLEVVGRTLFGLRVAIGLTAGALLLFSRSVSREFEAGFNRVETLLSGQLPEALQSLRGELRQLAIETGLTADALNGGLYQTLSALPSLASQPARAMSVLRTAAMVAATGFATMDEAVRAITGIMNAFNVEAEDSIDIADALFAAQDRGVTTFGEIAASMGRVTGILSALNLEWQDLLAVISTASPFLETSEVITGVGSAIEGILDPSPDAIAAAKRLGLEFNATALEAKGLVPFLEEVARKAEGVEDLSQLFGRREAVQLVAILSGNLAELADNLDAVSTNTGKTGENFETMADDAEFQSRRIKNAFKALVSPLGDEVNELDVAFKKFFANLLEGFNKAPKDMTETIEGMIELDGTLREIDQIVPTIGKKLGDMWDRFLEDVGEANEGLREFIDGLPDDGDGVRVTISEPQPFTGPGSDLIAEQTAQMRRDMIAFRRETEEATDEWRQFRNERADIFALSEAINNAKDLREELELMAALRFAETGDLDAFEESMRNVTAQVNAFVGTAVAELRQFVGLSDEELGPLVALLEKIPEKESEVSREVKRANDLLAEQARLVRLGLDGFGEIPTALQGPLRALGDVERKLEDVAKAIEETSDPARRAELRALEGVLEGQKERVEALLARLRPLADQYLEVDESAARLKETLEELEREGNLEISFGGTLPAELTSLLTQSGQLKRQIRDLQVQVAQTTDLNIRVLGTAALAGLQAELVVLEAQIARFPALGDVIEAFGDDIASLFTDLPEDVFDELLGTTSSLVDELQEFKDAQDDLTIAGLTKDADALSAAQDRMAKATERLRSAMPNVIENVRKMAREGKISKEVFEKLLATLEQIAGLEIDQKFQETAQKVADFADGLRGVLGQLDALPPKLDAVLKAVGDIAQGAGRIASGDFIGGGFQVLSGLIGGIKSLFGPSQREIEFKELQKSLDRLNGTIERQIALLNSVSGNDIAATVAAIQNFFSDVRDNSDKFIRGLIDLRGDLDALRDTLLKLGVTGDDVRQIAETLGLPLDDLADFMDGNAVSAGQLSDELEILDEALRGINPADAFEGVDGSLARMRAEADLFEQSSLEQADAMRKFLVQFANLGPELEAEILGLDLSTASGRARLEEIIESVSKALFAGELSQGDLGAFTVDQFLRALQDTKNAVEALAEEEGDDDETTSAGVFRGVTLVQGNQLVAIGQTSLFFLQDIATTLRAMASSQGVEIGPPLPVAPFPGFPVAADPGSEPVGAPVAATPGFTPSAPTPPQIPAGSPTLQRGGVAVSVNVTGGPVSITGVENGQDVLNGLEESNRRLSRRLAADVQEQMRNRGVVLE